MRAVVIGVLVAGCATTEPMRVPDLTLSGTSGPQLVLPRDLAAAKYTAFVFFAKGCGCFSAHQGRLRELANEFAPSGVRLVLVDPESGRTVDSDEHEVEARTLPAPIYLDPGAHLAKALHAEFATYVVVVDSAGKIRYRGGIDSDKSHLRGDATPYLRDALADLVAGREPKRAQTEPLGCVLETW
nr:redoxin domain-containing protein [Kofleriaceae bacterium]